MTASLLHFMYYSCMGRASQHNAQARAQHLFALADAQAGYFTPKQALVAGYSRRLQHHYRASGAWLRPERGLYRLRDYPASDDEQLARLTLWSRDQQDEPQAVVSFDTALRVYDLSDLVPERVHLTVPSTFRKTPPPGVVLHKTPLEPGDVKTRTAYRITTPLRTLLDIAASDLSPEHLHAATRQALERGLVRRRALTERLGALTPHARARLDAALADT